MPLQIQEIDDQNIWNQFLQAHPHNYFLQTWAWGDFQNQGLGKQVFRLGLFENGQLQAVCLAIEEISRFGKFVYCPRGPVLDWQNSDLRNQSIQALKDYFTNKNYLHLRLEPEVLNTETKVIDDFTKHVFQPAVKAIQVERAWVLNLENKTEEELLKEMRKNTRYYIKKGQKSGLKIEFSTSQTQIAEFTEMLAKMSQRKGFLLFDKQYLHKQFEYLAPHGILKLVSAKFEGQTVAMALIAYYGHEASYLHAASIEDTLKLEPSYYLQWESIKEAKRLGLQQYNFWGVVTDDKYYSGHPGYGYSNFKKGFGGEVKTYMRTRDFVYSSLKYQLFKLQEWYRAKKNKGV